MHFGRYIQHSLTTSSIYFQDPHNRIFAGEEMQIKYDDRDDRDRDLEIQMSRLGFTFEEQSSDCRMAQRTLFDPNQKEYILHVILGSKYIMYKT